MHPRFLSITGLLVSMAVSWAVADRAAAQALLGASAPDSHRVRGPSSAKPAGKRAPAAPPEKSRASAAALLPAERTAIERVRSGSTPPASQPAAASAGDAASGPGGAEASLSAAAAPRHGLLNPVAWQAALDRAGFSPGVIDGAFGPKTARALRAYQEYRGLPPTGQPDRATAESLDVDDQPALRRYVVTAADLAAIQPPPRRWQDKARVDLLGYESMAALIAERGHCTKWLVSRLNPGIDPTKLRAGDAVVLPHVEANGASAKAKAIEVDFATKTIRALDFAGKAIALFHCSIAKEHGQRPSGSCKIAEIVDKPKYLFDPKKWPEVKDVKEKLLIPPGPRSPVGLCWIGLSISGYGIHGTPEPELIGKTGSHGCFRMTNWDAQRLAGMSAVGIEVRLIDSTPRLAERGRRGDASLGAHRQ